MEKAQGEERPGKTGSRCQGPGGRQPGGERGEWSRQALGDEQRPHPKSAGRCQKVLDKEREGRMGPASSSPGLLGPGKAILDRSGNF